MEKHLHSELHQMGGNISESSKSITTITFFLLTTGLFFDQRGDARFPGLPETKVT